MKFSNQDDYHYLSGEKFSNGREIHFEFDSSDFNYLSRVDVLTDLVKDKKIIHLGCVDEKETIRHRMKRGKWLHKEMDDVAARCLGVDINEDGVEFIRNEIGYADIIVADVTAEPEGDLLLDDWDYFMVPEVLEHVNNPVDFLEKIRKHYKGKVKQMVITVPNAFTPENMSRAKKGVEVINTDHRFWFTPFTLAKVVINAGFTINDIIMCRHGRVKKRSFIKNYWYRRHPLARGDIVLIVDF